MEAVRHVTCTHCHWSLWTEGWAEFQNGTDCPRCGSTAVVGQRPDDVFPSDRRGTRFLRESDPQIAILDTQPV